MNEETKIFTSEDIEDLLRERFCPPAWAFLPQVRNGTGFSRSARTIDAIAMSLWPSRGLHMHGFEIKVRRGDWLNELKNPQKAEDLAQFCDFFWLAAPKDIVNTDEVPANWGLIIPHKAKCKVLREATILKPKPIDNLLLAAILRRAQETITPDHKINKAREEGRTLGRESAEIGWKYEKDEYISFKNTVAEFEKKSGIHIDKWDRGEIGEAVRIVLRGEHLNLKSRLESLLETAEKIHEAIKKELTEHTE